MTPTEDLIREHKAIKAMLRIMRKIAQEIKTGKGFDANDMEGIVDFLITFADKCHHGKEETALFPALVSAGIPKENGPVGLMLREHVIARGFINDINTGLENGKNGVDGSVDTMASDLINYVTLMQDHIEKEEKHLFPTADEVLSEQNQHDITEQFEKIEEEVVGHGVHEQYHKLLAELETKYPG
jgi:hemerythrin-like domain-containing protein